MTDTATLEAPAAAAAAPEAPSTIVEAEYPGFDGKVSFDCSTIATSARLDLLKDATARYIRNRLNQVQVRYNKDDKVIAWANFDKACEVDPLQSAVPKPDFERPAAPDYQAAFEAAATALREGKIRKQGTGERKERQRVDPLVKLVTDTVVREWYETRRTTDPKYTYPAAKKEVGSDGIAFLNARIEAMVAAGGNRADLEKMRDTKYVNPAKLMLGQTETKATKELPSLL